jgi:hypothetical protein
MMNKEIIRTRTCLSPACASALAGGYRCLVRYAIVKDGPAASDGALRGALISGRWAHRNVATLD